MSSVTPSAVGGSPHAPVNVEDDYTVQFPAGYGTSSSSFFPTLEQLLLPQCVSNLDQKRLGEIMDESCALNFSALQDSLYLRQGVRIMQKDMIKYKREADSKQEDIDTLHKEKEDMAAQLKEAKQESDMLRDQLSRIQGVNQGCIDEVRKLKARVQQLKDQSVEVGTYYAWETKIQCLEAHHAGEMASWNLEEERAEFEKAYKDKPEVGVYSDDEEQGEVNSPLNEETAGPSTAQDVPLVAPVDVLPSGELPVEENVIEDVAATVEP